MKAGAIIGAGFSQIIWIIIFFLSLPDFSNINVINQILQKPLESLSTGFYGVVIFLIVSVISDTVFALIGGLIEHFASEREVGGA